MGINRNITVLIKSYLKRRKFRVKIGNHLTEEREIEAVVPQGSVLGPILFNIYMADIPALRYCKLAQFADDTAIYTHHRQAKTLSNRLQTDLDTICEFFKKWKTKINNNKTVAMVFSKRARRRPPKLYIEDNPINWTHEAKYLGVTLDSKLKLRTHLKEIRQKAGQITHKLYPLINKESKLDINNKLTLIKSIILPSMTYACEVYRIVDRNKLMKLQVFLNKVTRMALSAPWYVSNLQIRNDCKMKTIEEISKERTEKLKKTMLQHSNELIRTSGTRRERRATDSHTGVIASIT